MSHTAFVTKLNNVHKDPNSDRLYLADCFGEGVIVGAEMYTGQTVLYLPADGKVARFFGDKFNLFRHNKDGTNQGGYIEDNQHIKAIKLRGNMSSGVVIALDNVYQIFGNQHWSDGEAVTKINGKEFYSKYIPEQKNAGTTPGVRKGKSRNKSKNVIKYPEFEEHIDTQQLAYNLAQFQPGDLINLTLKMHGTSQRSMRTYAELPQGFFRRLFHMKPKTKEVCVLGTRRCVVDTEKGGFYGNDSFRIPHHEKLAAVMDENMEVFYEVVGFYGQGENDTIMPACDNTKINDKAFVKEFGKKTKFTYGCQPGECQMYIYRITSENGEREWTPAEITAWCKKHGFNRVPVIDDFVFTTPEDLMERINKYFEDKRDPVGKTHIKEGVVVRIVNRRKFTAFKHKLNEFRILTGAAVENANTEGLSEDIIEEM